MREGDGHLDWRIGLAWSVFVAAAVCRLLWPSLFAPGLLLIAPVAAAAFASPRLVASMAAAGMAFAAAAEIADGAHSVPSFAGRAIGWTAAGALAYGLARQRATRDARLAELATLDPLTGLANRHLLNDRLDAQLSVRGRTAPSAVLYLDLDGFKGVNDRLGHHAGDAVLIAVADRLRACVRSEDTIARVGGDEFVIACPDVDGALGLTSLCQRISATLARPVHTPRGPVTISVTTGAVLIPPGARAEVGELIDAADQVLIALKASGKGTYRIVDRPAPVDHRGEPTHIAG
jgi:diguanylate cyclase (GGDEF)-like protein